MSDKKARDVMSSDCTCVGENDTVLDAAKRLAEKDVGSLPICGEDDRLKGMLTDPINEALRTMIDHKVRRLPVIDGRELVGIISQADIATTLTRSGSAISSRRSAAP